MCSTACAQDRPRGGASATRCHRIGTASEFEGFCREPVVRREVQQFAVEAEYVAELGPAKTRRASRDGVEHRLRVVRGRRDNAQNFAGGRLLLQGLRKARLRIRAIAPFGLGVGGIAASGPAFAGARFPTHRTSPLPGPARDRGVRLSEPEYTPRVDASSPCRVPRRPSHSHARGIPACRRWCADSPSHTALVGAEPLTQRSSAPGANTTASAMIFGMYSDGRTEILSRHAGMLS